MFDFNSNKFPLLETPRLLLRAPAISDASEVLALRGNTVAMEFIPRPLTTSTDAAVQHINDILKGFSDGMSMNLGIALKENPAQLIGFIGYPRMNLPHYRAEIGYMLHPAYWRKGIMNEALEKVVDFGFSEMRLHKVSANIDPENDASRQLLLKNGFIKEGYFKEDFYYEGRFLDSEIYGKLAPLKEQ